MISRDFIRVGQLRVRVLNALLNEPELAASHSFNQMTENYRVLLSG